MSKQPQLKAIIEMEGKFKVGPNPQPPNQFKLSITNQGETLELTPEKCLYLKGTLGTGERALFFDKTDARKSERKIPTDWTAEWDFSLEKQGFFSLKIYTYKPFENGENVIIAFSKVVSKTYPGKAILSVEEDFTPSKQDIYISKVAEKPDIISFYSEPPGDVQNLPGEVVTLKWHIHKLNDLELIQNGIADPLSCDFSKDEGSKKIRVSDSDMNFRLKGYDGSKLIERDLQIKVLRPGWHEIKNTVFEGDPGYIHSESTDDHRESFDLEPTLLFNANDQHLYAIFRQTFPDKEKAFLFKTRHPFGRWTIVKSPDADEDGSIPEGFSTSPGVYFNDKLWFIGGSQIDPDDSSNNVWCFDPEKESWEQVEDADWSPRMGHAVIEFQNKIWVMGGRDDAGNALNDVWSLDIKNNWEQHEDAAWEPRCLINPVVYNNQIWLYGGAKEPFSTELFDDLYAYANGEWHEMEMTDIIKGNESKRPIASCLQVFNDKLHLFGKFRTEHERDNSRLDEPLGFCLSDKDAKTWERFPTDGLKTWGEYTTFCYQSVNFKDRMLIAKALGNEISNSVLKVYIPG